jgi:hypothetical protein
MFWSINFWRKTLQDPASFWAMVAAITTVAIAWVAYRQLSDLARTNKSDFLYKLKKDFFTEETRRLVFLLENELLEFQSTEIPYFRILRPDNADTQNRVRELGITGDTVETGVIDDVLLGPLEDVGILLSRNLVSLEEAYEQFDSYVQLCAEDKAIGEYLAWSREGAEDEDVFDHFQSLYRKLELHGPRIRERKRKK